MTDTLRRIQAKVTRANQHIQDFQLALTAFHDTKPYAVAIKEDTQTGKRIYYVAKSDPIPDGIATIAADVIQNLRSPLDQIAYQLVLDARGGVEPNWHVYYPICSNAKDYPALRQNFIRGVRKEVTDAIDAAEPYKGGKGHASWQLNELNKPDKHKLLVSAGAFSAGVEIMPPKAFMESAMKMATCRRGSRRLTGTKSLRHPSRGAPTEWRLLFRTASSCVARRRSVRVRCSGVSWPMDGGY
jgi:hypothetical protein